VQAHAEGTESGDSAEDRCYARGINEGSARVEEWQRLLRVVSRVRGGLVLRAWTWYGVGDDAPRVW
jgi:hypothetical protein